MECHLCGTEADWHCKDCGEPTCEDCLVPFTLQNQIDYCLCNSCYEGRETERYFENCREEELRDKVEAEKKIKRDKRRANYWKPENVAKRKEIKRLKNIARVEANRKMLAEAFKIVGEMFGGE